MAKQPWYDSDNPSTVVRGGGWRLGVVVIVVMVFFGLIGIALWAFGVFTSDIKGKGDAIKTKNSAPNRIGAQEAFRDRYEDILAADKRIDTLAQGLKLSPDSQVAQTNYLGAVTYCQQAVAAYNADTQKYTRKDFLDADLPQRIDDLDPATDCKETVK